MNFKRNDGGNQVTGGFLDRLLTRYDDSDYIIKLKSRFLLRVSITAITIFPFIIAYNIYLSLTKAAYGYAIYWPIIAPLLAAFIIFFIVIILVIKGRFTPAGHILFIASQLLIWSIMFIDKSGPVERLDTIVVLFAILSMSPLVIKNRPVAIPVYSAATVLGAVLFARLVFPEMGLPATAMIDYIGDIIVASAVVVIMAYNLFSINRAALDRSEESRRKLAAANVELEALNEDLVATNEELEAAMEELAATNEEFEAQNRELTASQRIIGDSLEEKNVLLREIHHRVKNNMQIISSLLNMQADNIGDPRTKTVINDAISRIHSMALIHEKIYQSGSFSRVDMAAYIEQLLKDIIQLSMRGSDALQVSTRFDSIPLSIEQAIPCGILINEILTNSIKHACVDDRPCRIELAMSAADGVATLEISDSGPGFDAGLLENNGGSTMGLQLVNALARQLNAELSINVDKGARFTIRFGILKRQ